jgi:hypothetical protein
MADQKWSADRTLGNTGLSVTPFATTVSPMPTSILHQLPDAILTIESVWLNSDNLANLDLNRYAWKLEVNQLLLIIIQ